MRAILGAQFGLQHMLVADAFREAGGGGLDVDAVQHLVEQQAVDAAPHPAQLERRRVPQLLDVDDAGAVQPLLHARADAPTVLNAVFNTAQFWDGRAKDLEQQAGGPIVNPIEMGSPEAHVAEQLKGIPGYREYFAKAFPGEADPVTLANTQKAIAVFEATLITPNSPFDRFLGGKPDALSPKQRAGLALFMDKGCSSCHNGINVGGGMYAPFGVVEKPGAELLPPNDKGRFVVTKTPSDEYVFKVPTLRNIALTAPYFHTGKAWDLRQAVAVMGTSQLGTQLTDDEIDKITAFLDSLTGEQPKVAYPILPPSVATTPRPQP